MPTIYAQTNGKNTKKKSLGVFVFLFSLFLFFQLPSLDSSFLGTITFSVNVANAQCAPGAPTAPTGGLVPCGRMVDDQSTPLINENAPCDLCAGFYMLKKIINFVAELAIGISILILVISGLRYVFSSGNPGQIESAKSAITHTLLGLSIVFVAWLMVAAILQGMGYANITTWNQVNCNLTPGGPPTVLPFCGDGKVEAGEEVCDWSVSSSQGCTTTYDTGLPSYCSGIPVSGTQSCNCTCDGWNDCVASPPVLTSNNYGACSSANTYITNYSCCELTGCNVDSCCNGQNTGTALLPGGYAERGKIDFIAPGSCKLGQKVAVNTDWAIAVNHTTAGYRCWK